MGFLEVTLRCHQTWHWKIPYEWRLVVLEKHRTRWWVFQQAIFDYWRVAIQGVAPQWKLVYKPL